MATAVKSTNHKPSETEYEISGAAGAAAVTEHELPSAQASNADTETTNTATQAQGESAVSELGSVDGLATDESELAPLDAILGSYPELANSAEIIIGTDDRVRVGNTTTFPWRAICHLIITSANNRTYVGTGWLIAPRTVMTAGHCVYMHADGGWVRSIQVIPGRNSGVRPFGTHVGTTFRSVTGWTQNQNRDNDYGAIILPPSSRPGDQTGYFGFATRNDDFLKAAALNLSGYPGEKNGEQWFMAQSAKAVSDRVITYNIDTTGGQSGSPVWVLQNGNRYGVGVHTNGANSGNSATRINSAVFNNMSTWKSNGM